MALVACPKKQTQPTILKLASGNGLGALTNGLSCHIQTVLQPTGDFSSQCPWQLGAVIEHLSVVGSGLTSVSFYNPLSFL